VSKKNSDTGLLAKARGRFRSGVRSNWGDSKKAYGFIARFLREHNDSALVRKKLDEIELLELAAELGGMYIHYRLFTECISGVMANRAIKTMRDFGLRIYPQDP